MPWGQMPPETVQWIQSSITTATNWLMGAIQELYIDGPLANYLPAEFEDALNHVVDGLNSAWMIDSTAQAQEVLDRFPGLEDRFPGLAGGSTGLGGIGTTPGGDWTGIITRPPSLGGNIEAIQTQVVDPFTNYINAILLPQKRQYFNLYWLGYITKSELLEYTGSYSMMHFYQSVGADPSFMNPIKTSRENGQMNDAQLVTRMGLDNINQVNSILGIDWRMRLDLKESLNQDGFGITMAESQILTNAYINDILTHMTQSDAQLLEGLASTMDGLGFDDAPLDYRSLVINGAIEEATAIVAEGQQSISAYFASMENTTPVLTSNAFSAILEPKIQAKSKKSSSVAESTIKTDLIQSQIALAMRQIDGDAGSVGSFSASKDTFAALEVSFASPFEGQKNGVV